MRLIAMETDKIKVEIKWSYFRLPGFRKLLDKKGYVPCKECFKKKTLPNICPHELKVLRNSNG
jgi:hypothetical protein